MYLQRLEIQGFKSFAQKTVFLFPAPQGEVKGITAVVGPNGSGKSNVADAIRWVLGEQSMKNLRSKRSEDVIFFGSQKKAQLGFCEVSLFFNNEDRVLPLDFSEVLITRRLYRNGDSEYYLNKNKVRLSDVVLLIAQANFGPKSISVIGQGMIDSIINAPASERKEYFDEAAGVKQYQIKKDQSLQKLKLTRDNLSQAQMLVGELEPKIRFFNRQLKRLEEREALEKEYFSKGSTYYNLLWNELKKNLSDKRKEQQRVQEAVDGAVKIYREFEANFTLLEKKNSVVGSSQEYAALQREYDALSREKQKLIERRSVLDGRIKTEFERAGKAEVSFLLARQKELQELTENNTSEKSEIEQTLLDLKTREQELTSLLARHEGALREQEGLLAVAQRQTKSVTHENIHAELRTIHGLKETLFSEGLTLQSLQQLIAGVYEQIELLIQKIEGSLGKKDNSFLELQKTIDEMRAKRAQVLEDVQALRVRIGVSNEQTRSLSRRIDEAKNELTKLNSDIAYFSSDTPTQIKEQLETEKAEIQSRLEELNLKTETLRKSLTSFHEQENESHKALLDLQRAITSKGREIESLKESHTRVSLEIARAEAHQEELLKKICEELKVTQDQQVEIERSIETLSSLLGFQDTVEVADRETLKNEIDYLKRRLEQIGSIDQEALSEYESTKERYEFLTNQITDLSEAIVSLTNGIRELNGIIKERFDDALERINQKFDEYFKILFSGGAAKLTIQKREKEEPKEGELEIKEVDPLKELEQEDEVAGIDIFATPPEKKLKNVSVLSGGEKAMTAIALLCAIVSNNPSPFVVLDEVDAALDDSNAHRFANIIQELTTQTQFIIITHNRVTIHTAQVLYGVTMGDDGISKVLSLDIENVSGMIRQS